MDYGFSHLKPNDDRQSVWAEQRAERGFDDTETWALDSVIARFITPRLKRFRELTIGHPGHLTMEQYCDILDEIIEAFEMISNRDDHVWLDTWNQAKVNKGLKLFAEYYFNLWW